MIEHSEEEFDDTYRPSSRYWDKKEGLQFGFGCGQFQCHDRQR